MASRWRSSCSKYVCIGHFPLTRMANKQPKHLDENSIYNWADCLNAGFIADWPRRRQEIVVTFRNGKTKIYINLWKIFIQLNLYIIRITYVYLESKYYQEKLKEFISLNMILVELTASIFIDFNLIYPCSSNSKL